MARVIFGSQAELSLIIAPVMLFHFVQLVIVSFIAGHYAGRPDDAAIPAATPDKVARMVEDGAGPKS